MVPTIQEYSSWSVFLKFIRTTLFSEDTHFQHIYLLTSEKRKPSNSREIERFQGARNSKLLLYLDFFLVLTYSTLNVQICDNNHYNFNTDLKYKRYKSYISNLEFLKLYREEK